MTANSGYEVGPTSLLSRQFLQEIWFFRRLIGLFIWRDIIVRYKNTMIGAAWYVLQPLAMMLVFTIFFGGLFARYIGALPYPVFAYGGLLLWQLFSRSLSLGAQSLIYFGPMLGKVYFPRIIAPASFVIGTLFDFFITAMLMVVMMLLYGITPRWTVMFVPIILLFTLMFSMGCGSVLAAVDARYRDIRHAVPLMIQVWMFCTPVMYPISYIPEKWRLLYALNPMVGLTETFRWSIFGIGDPPSLVSLFLAAGISSLMFVAGTLFFQKVQGTLVDTLYECGIEGVERSVDEFAIRAFGLGKQYRLRETGGVVGLAAKMARRLGLRKMAESPASHFWALRDVSFDIRKGEVVGIIGHNGAGKSTLLKILTRITNPTLGTASVRGRVGMLLEVGTGFHEDLTGHENVYLGGAILGMTRAEIRQKYDDIVAFAEMDGFMDLAVRHYSSGMKLRLALSVAIHLDAEVIFLDEIWAVGDHAFQIKTWSRIEALIASGRTFVIVAHNLETIGRLCTRCLLLDHGRLTMDGAPDAVITRYRQELRQRSQSERASPGLPLLKSVDITALSLTAENVPMGDMLDCRFTLMAQRPGTLRMAALIKDGSGKTVAVGTSNQGRWTSLPVSAGRNQLRCQLPVALAQCGGYDLLLQISENDAVITAELPFAVVEREILIKDERGQDVAVPSLPVVWDVEEDSQATVRLVTSG